ncbi:Uracil DNA glycosylase superfamily protein [Planctomycetes bacterium CA13]|uniref:Type-4 uracil-DNA glycosylase n=1 Tax=Novipirellula herctigrandis TaxID=2527986 RepID=A0A5C5YWG8_9BACT|nr:Uracil DNA glycosylase superfamily protein [Planctomycetes bacterium CA13]
MSESKQTTVHADRLDRDAILLQAAAIASHLQRSGVQFLPKSNPETVAEMVSQFAIATPDTLPDSPKGGSPKAGSPEQATGEPVAGSTVNRPNASARSRASTRHTASATVKPSHSLLADAAKPYPGPSLSVPDRQAILDLLAAEVEACTKCPQLVRCRTNTVFGEGNPAARVVFFGEGPGADEDKTGRPFVGKAGQLLTKMIEACTFRREDIYILNTVKCRPPGNRNPDPEEIVNCRDFFEKQLETIRPEYIVCLGAVSSQALLDSKLSVGRLRGKFHAYFGSKVVVTYHPAYLLRNPAAKKAAWDDLQMMLRDAGIQPKR